ncbi:MAG: S9 family peptidase [Candidatus Aminicenantes bacterium]|nr:MAG: S9 family peptidase [Candidatus Aminicenantes bacterium]
MGKKPQDVTFQSADRTDLYGCFRCPPGAGRFPAVIFIHGGFGNNKEYTRELLDWGIAELLLREGFVVFSTDYRMEPEEKAIDDVIACFEYVSEMSFVDGDKIVYFGDSHGSFLGVMAAMRTDAFAIIHCWGVAHFAEWYEYIKDSQSPGLQQIAKMFKESFGGTPDQVPEAYRQASVVAHVDKLRCPVLIIHGEKDDEVPVTQAYKLADSLKRLKHEYELKIFENEGHGIRDSEAKKEMESVVLEFLKRHLK